MKQRAFGVLLVLVLVVALPSAVQAREGDAAETWLSAGENLAAGRGEADGAPAAGGFDRLAAPGHTIEGVGGGRIVPVAYLVNPGKEGTIISLPSVSFTYIGGFTRSKKNLLTFAISQTFFRRIELSYALNRADLGRLRGKIKRVIGNNIRLNRIYMHNFNIRGLLVEEGSFGCSLTPAVTAGLHFKYNDTIGDINKRLLVNLDTLGYEKDNGMEFTISVTKRIEVDPVPPIVLTVGLRNSDAAYAGHMGFSSDRSTTVEVNVAAFPLDWLRISYEFRRKQYPFNAVPAVAGTLLRPEGNWHAINADFFICDNVTIGTGVMWLSKMADSRGDGALNFQIKWDI